MMIRVATVTVLTLVSVMGMRVWGGQNPQPRKAPETDKLKQLMHKKLASAQKLLEGIAIEDFGKISKSANELTAISKSLQWKVIDSPGYELRSNEFRRILEGVKEKANEKNLDGVALGYVELTLSCVKCHKYVRSTRSTSIDRPVRELYASVKR